MVKVERHETRGNKVISVLTQAPLHISWMENGTRDIFVRFNMIFLLLRSTCDDASTPGQVSTYRGTAHTGHSMKST